MPDDPAPRCAILLSTYNGAAYLAPFLDSLLAQSEPGWVLFWRDDGSRDETVDLMTAWGTAHPGRLLPVTEPGGNLGVMDSFMTLLRAAETAAARTVFFADQDDVWLPEKIALALPMLAGVPEGRPALYCARQRLVDGALREIGLSASLAGPAGFPACLTQNIATGCTVALNRPALALLAASRPPSAGWHDWWCYLLVSAAGGLILRDERAVILYRQHGANVVGAPASPIRRALAALRRGPQEFMSVFRKNVAALQDNDDVLAQPARAQLARIARGLSGGPMQRLKALATPGFQRNGMIQTLLFRLWFLLD